jgi:hypothetical protein
LVGCDRHFYFISDSKQKQTAFFFAERYLADDLIKALRKKLLSHWTDAAFTSLSFHQLLVKHLTKLCNVNSGCRVVADILDVVLAYQPFQ